VARFSIPTGKHDFSIGSNRKTLDVNGAYALIVARVINNQVYWSQPVYTAKMPANIMATPAPQIVEPEIAPRKAVSRKKVGKSSKKRGKK
jgi:hypothetical protein